MKKFKKIILFDFDGTLADSYSSWLEIVATLADRYKLANISVEELEKLRDSGARELMKRFKVPIYKIPFIARDMRRLQRLQLDSIAPFVGISEMLTDLKKQGYQLGILTSDSKQNVDLFLKNHRIELFDYIESGVGIFGKERALKKFLLKHKFLIEDVVYVGDEIRDIEACVKAGIRIIAVSWGFNTKVGLQKSRPDLIIDRPSELADSLNFFWKSDGEKNGSG